MRTLSAGTAPTAGEGIPDRDDLLALYRHRSEVLLASSFLAANGTPHRLRMSGLPGRIAPWIGATLAEADSPRLGRRDFMDRRAARVEGTALASCEAAQEWEHGQRQLFFPPATIGIAGFRCPERRVEDLEFSCCC